MGKPRSKSSRYAAPKEPSRKPIRPLERQRMRPWLIDQLDRGDVSQLNWLNKREKTFRISWRHAARQGWDADVDASLFERWARHTGKYYDGDEPDAKKWKANFRCALNSLPDVEEVKDLGIKKGQNAFKVYRFLDERRVKSKRSKASISDEEDDTFEILQSVSRARRCQKARELDLDSEGSEACLSPKHEPIDSSDHDSSSTDMDTNQEDHAYPSSLPLFDKFCNFGTGLVQPKLEVIHRLPEASSPQYPCSSSDDESKSTTSSVPTDEEVVEMLLDEPEYSPFLWDRHLEEVDEEQIVEESIVDQVAESQSRYFVLASNLGSPNVVVQQTENLADCWAYTGLELESL